MEHRISPMTYVNVSVSTEGALDLLARHPLLKGLERAPLADLCEQATLQRLPAGSTVFHEGDDAAHCLLVASGSVEVLRFGAEGGERVAHCFERGQLVAEAAMFMPHGRYPMTARAPALSTVWRFGRARVRGACERHPALAMRLLESFSQRLYRRINEVEWLTTSNAQQRLAAYLVTLAEQQGEWIELPTSQRQLAAQLGVRAETLSRLLADWQLRGWISGERRRWCLLAGLTLRQMAGGSVRPF